MTTEAFVHDREEVLQHIRENGHMMVESATQPDEFTRILDLADEVFEEAFSGTQHGEDVQQALKQEIPGRPEDSKVYVRQRVAGETEPGEADQVPATETKRVLQVSPYSFSQAREYLRTRGRMSRAMTEFFHAEVDIREQSLKNVAQVAGPLGLLHIIEPPAGSPYVPVDITRILAYPGETTGDNPAASHGHRAELHFDLSLLTDAEFSDQPGLVGGPGYNTVGDPNLLLAQLAEMSEHALASPAEYVPGWSNVFFGGKLFHLPAEVQAELGHPPAFLHGVKDVNPGTPRRAFVRFYNHHTGHTMASPLSTETGLGLIWQQVKDRQVNHGMPAEYEFN